MKFRVIDGCPCPASIAPYVYLVLRRAGQTASSIYRGDDHAAVRILHAHGKHTQAEIHRMMPAISNPPGRSQHELRSDGVGNPHVPAGGLLQEWQVGIDAGGDDYASRTRIEAAARHYGWKVRHPYSRGVEGHHFCFAEQPRPNRLAHKAAIIGVRARLALR